MTEKKFRIRHGAISPIVIGEDVHLVLSSSHSSPTVVASGSFIVSDPGIPTATAPTIALQDGDSGFFEDTDDQISVATAGTQRFIFDNANSFQAANTNGPEIRNNAPSATTPVFRPDKTDTNTGIGQNAADQLSMIAGGIEALRIDAVGRLISPTQHMILSSTAGSQIYISGNLKLGIGTTTQNRLILDDDEDTYIYASADDIIRFYTGGVNRSYVNNSWAIIGTSTNAGGIVREAPSATNPVFTFGSDADTGVGTAGANQVSLIAGAIEALRIDSAGQLIAPTQHLILSSTAGSIVYVSGNLKLGLGTTTDRRLILDDDEDTYIYANADDQVAFYIAGSRRFRMITGGSFLSDNSAGPRLIDQAASTTNPTISPNQSDGNTGLGGTGADGLSLIAGGVEAVRIDSAGRMIGPTQHLILSSTAGSIVYVSGNLKLGIGSTTQNRLILDDDEDSYIYAIGDDQVAFVVNGTADWYHTAGRFIADNPSGPALQNEAASSTNPVVLPNRNDADTGIGQNAADQLSMIAGGVEAVRIDSAGRMIGPTQHLILSSTAGSLIMVSGSAHIREGSSGVTPPAGMVLNLESDTSPYVSILSVGGANGGGFIWGDPDQNNIAEFAYIHGSDKWYFYHDSIAAYPLSISGSGRIGLNTLTPDVRLHVHEASAGSVTAHSNAIVAIERNTHAFINFLSPNTTAQGFYFGDPDDNTEGEFYYHHGDSSFYWYSGATNVLHLSSSGDLTTAGGIKIGAATTTADGTIRWTGSDLEGRKGGAWVSLTAGGASAAGSNGQVQYNNGGSLAGASGLVYSSTNDWVGIGATVPSGSLHIHSASANDVWITANTGSYAFINFKTSPNNIGAWLGYDESVDILQLGSTVGAAGRALFTHDIGTKATAFLNNSINNQSVLYDFLDNGFASDTILRIAADDANPYALIVGNNTYSTVAYYGIGMYTANTGYGSIDMNNGGAKSHLILQESGVATGYVGIGTNGSPSAKLHILSGTSAGAVAPHANTVLHLDKNSNTGMQFSSPSTGIGYIDFADPQNQYAHEIGYVHTDEHFYFYSGDGIGNYVMSLSSSGHVLIGGYAGAEARLHIYSGSAGSVAAYGDAFSNTLLVIEHSKFPYVQFQSPKANGGGFFWGNPTTAFEAEFAYGSSDETFYFWKSGYGYPMTMSSSGDVNIGVYTTTSSTRKRFNVEGTGFDFIARFFNDGNDETYGGLQVQAGLDAGTGQTYYLECRDGNGSEVGYLENNAGTFQLVDFSDENLKADITTSQEDALAKINNIGHIQYRFKRHGTNGQVHPIGFSAQNINAVFSSDNKVVSVSKDGNLGVARTALIPYLTKAIQQLTARVEQLEAQLSGSI